MPDRSSALTSLRIAVDYQSYRRLSRWQLATFTALKSTRVKSRKHQVSEPEIDKLHISCALRHVGTIQLHVQPLPVIIRIVDVVTSIRKPMHKSLPQNALSKDTADRFQKPQRKSVVISLISASFPCGPSQTFVGISPPASSLTPRSDKKSA